MGGHAMKEVVRRTALLMIVALVMVAGGCQSRQQQESSRQEYVESIMAILTQVQKNLSRIQQKEAVVERLSSDIEKKEEKSAEELGRDINASIRFIDSTLQSSKNLVSRLEEENKNSAYRIASVDQLTAELRSTIEKKDREIQELKTEVQNLDRQVTELLETVDVLDEFIIEQEDKLSFAYYISGTYDDLVEKGILARSTNPLAGIFNREYRLTQDFDVSLFQRIDIIETRDLFFERSPKNLKIVTPHTTDSYEMIGGESSALLLIRDENEFWKKSRCLVIVIEE
ncbi:hypothetical protein CR161_06810 [Prosthecochloris sp. ZM]|uniref:Uncharacterized protein n=2 Tax=Prosthecochloris TaxID=1101 RepID=B4S7K3_PROA2|nr:MULTISPECIES: biogenesis of lysosome-related organelles complex 1 subunit 2 [Prosthecochloris]ACF46040.1 conserved hypothetical protein [Prosthecochloris aestuarii DSM 271]RDD30446.1 hypothetical protein CR161_06810 [Prosthecochloris sp. ZM]